jgi:hypothetical protein
MGAHHQNATKRSGRMIARISLSRAAGRPRSRTVRGNGRPAPFWRQKQLSRSHRIEGEQADTRGSPDSVAANLHREAMPGKVAVSSDQPYSISIQSPAAANLTMPGAVRGPCVARHCVSTRIQQDWSTGHLRLRARGRSFETPHNSVEWCIRALS